MLPRKTDSEIEQWVLRELSFREQNNSREVCVFARDGVVTLRGSARSYQDKLAVEEATLRAPAVVDVLNEMKVKPCSELIGKGVASVPLTESPGPGVLFSPRRI